MGAVVLKIECASESPRDLYIQIAVLHSPIFYLSISTWHGAQVKLKVKVEKNILRFNVVEKYGLLAFLKCTI